MLSASVCNAAMAGNYYKGDDYYSKESNRRWFGKGKQNTNLEKTPFKIDDFNKIVSDHEKFNTIDIKFILSKELSNQIKSSPESLKSLINSLKEIGNKIQSFNKNLFKLKYDKLNNSFKYQITNLKNDKSISFKFTSHNIQKSNVNNVIKKINIDILSITSANIFNSNLKNKTRKVLKNDFKINVFKNPGRIGIDFTYSAPKSCSLEMHLSGISYNDITESHNKAVNKSLKFIEDNYAYYRLQYNKEKQILKSDNILCSVFEHYFNRNADPQLHSHCVIFNSTTGHDNIARSLHNDYIFKNKYLLDKIYMNELAFELKNRGYDLSFNTPIKNNFNIKHYSDEILQKFSSRRQDIIDKLNERGLEISQSTREERQIANLTTREKKEKIEYDIKSKEIKEYLNNHDIFSISKRNFEQLNLDKNKIISEAFKIVENNNSVFTKEQYLSECLDLSQGRVKFDDILNYFEKNKQILYAGSYRFNNINYEYFTTIKNREIEREVYKFANQIKPVNINLNSSLIDKYLQSKSLTSDQIKCIKFLTEKNHGICGIIGDAGTGKTTMLKELNNILTSNHIKIIAVAPTNKAVSEIKNAANINDSYTIHSFLNKLEKKSSGKSEIFIDKNTWNLDNLGKAQTKTIIVCDEASMIDNKIMLNLMTAAKKLEAKIVLIGDNKQLLPVSQGKPFNKFIEKNIIESIRMKTPIRFKNAKKFVKESVNFTAAGKINLGLNALKENVNEIVDLRERFKHLSKEFIKLSKSDREQSIIITSLNRDRIVLNTFIRDELKSNNLLKNSRIINVNINGKLEKKDFCVNDRIIFLKTDILYGNKINKNDFGFIDKINKDNITIRMSNNKIIQFNSNKYNFFDYGYVSTTYKVQGASYKNVFLNIDSKQPISNNLNDFYVKISRSKYDIQLFTDNYTKLYDQLWRPQFKLLFKDVSKQPLRLIEIKKRTDGFNQLPFKVKQDLLRADKKLENIFNLNNKSDRLKDLSLFHIKQNDFKTYKLFINKANKIDLKINREIVRFDNYNKRAINNYKNKLNKMLLNVGNISNKYNEHSKEIIQFKYKFVSNCNISKKPLQIDLKNVSISK